MVLPFVRDLFAEVEKSANFARAASLLKTGAGRIRLSGLTPTAKAMLYPLLAHASGHPLILVVADNRAAEEMLPIVQSFCELSGACAEDSVTYLPARDVLPFENLSPHPVIQEARARTLWRIATGAVSIVIVPFASSSTRLRDASFYAGLARTLRRNEAVDLDALVQHLNVVGYNAADVGEMPGDYALRGGIFDVYPSEFDRPLRVEFFGDEVESIRKFDPETQRSLPASDGDEIVLLPLTETPVSEEILGAIHARLSGRRLEGSEEVIEQAVKSGGATVFPGWEFYAPVAGADQTIFDLMPNARALVDEPELIQRDLTAWWERIVDAHERSGVGNLVRPEELYLPPEDWKKRVATSAGADIEQLGITTSEGVEELSFVSQPTTRFHGSVPELLEEIQKLNAEHRRVLVAAGSLGELERMSEIFNEYNVPFRLGSRTSRGAAGTYADEAGYFAEDLTATTLVRAYVPQGVVLPESSFVLFGSGDLFDESDSIV